jgi:hypothetical protein
MRFEVEEIGEQAGAGVASDFNLLPPLPEIEGEDVVLLAMARESLLDGHVAGPREASAARSTRSRRTRSRSTTPGCASASSATRPCCSRTSGTRTSTSRSRAGRTCSSRATLGRLAPLRGRARRSASASPAEKAAEIKETQVTLDPAARFADPNSEKASRAALGAAGQILSLLQSAVLFCKSQVKVTG